MSMGERPAARHRRTARHEGAALCLAGPISDGAIRIYLMSQHCHTALENNQCALPPLCGCLQLRRVRPVPAIERTIMAMTPEQIQALSLALQLSCTSVLQSAGQAVITVDESQQVVMINAAAQRMFGCTQEQAVGRSLGCFLPARYRPTTHSAKSHCCGAGCAILVLPGAAFHPLSSCRTSTHGAGEHCLGRTAWPDDGGPCRSGIEQAQQPISGMATLCGPPRSKTQATSWNINTPLKGRRPAPITIEESITPAVAL